MCKLQPFEEKSLDIRKIFVQAFKENPAKFATPLTLSWSNWGFGQETLATTAKRLQKNGIRYIELHGNRYGRDLGYKSDEVKNILGDADIKAAGICGMFRIHLRWAC